jgi:hypothetical protein
MADIHEEYLAGRQKWEHEDNLINQRLTWLLNSQSLFFAAYAIALQAVSSPNPDPRVYKFLTNLPYIGITTCILILLGVIAATNAMRLLKQDKRFIFDVRPSSTWTGLLPTYLLPVSFIFAWLLVR